MEIRSTMLLSNYVEYDCKVYQIGGKEFDFSKAYIMGILNVTPDSFSDGENIL